MKSSTPASFPKQQGFAPTPVVITSNDDAVPKPPTFLSTTTCDAPRGVKRRVVLPEKKPSTKKPKRVSSEPKTVDDHPTKVLSSSGCPRDTAEKHQPLTKTLKQRSTKRCTGSVHEKIVRAIVDAHSLGFDKPRRSQVAVLSGVYTKVTAGLAKVFSALKSAGIVEYPTSETVKLSEFGEAALSKGYPDLGIGPIARVQVPQDNSIVQERLLTAIRKTKGSSPNKMVQVFNALLDGDVHTREDVARKTGYPHAKHSGFVKVLSSLGGLGIVEYPDSTTVWLAEVAFPRGRNAQSGSVAASATHDNSNAASTSEALERKPAAKTSNVHGVSGSFPLANRNASSIKVENEQQHTLSSNDTVRERICNGLIELLAINEKYPSRSLLALFSGFKNETSGTFATGIASLARRGTVRTSNNTVQLTEFGISSLPSMSAPMDNAEMQQHLQHLLKEVNHYPDKIDALFGILKDGRAHSRGDVATATGFGNVTTGVYSTMLSTLRNIGIIQYPAAGMVQLANIAFPYGRRTVVDLTA